MRANLYLYLLKNVNVVDLMASIEANFPDSSVSDNYPDVDECKEKLACQCPECNCKNTWGSYDCSCSNGMLYMQEHDTCISESPLNSSSIVL